MTDRHLPNESSVTDESLFVRLAFWLFAGSILFSIAGMGFLSLFPSAMAVFAPMYPTLVKAPTWIFMVTLAVLPLLTYGPALGWPRTILFFGWGCFVGGASELIGTTGLLSIGNIALPFGKYQYTQWLGPKIAGHVPYFIPPSWFAMSIVSLDLARRITSRRRRALLLGTLFMVLWDVSLDPAMNRAFPFWVYGANGFYFGMPLSNWMGWTIVTLVILLGYEYLETEAPINSLWAPWIYALTCLFPISISLLRGLPWAALIGTAAAAVPYLLLWIYNPAHLIRSARLLPGFLLRRSISTATPSDPDRP